MTDQQPLTSYQRAKRNAVLGASRCGRSYIYRLTNGDYYNSDNPPATINARHVATVEINVNVAGTTTLGGPDPDGWEVV
jgi:hypothetical protein